MSSSVRLLLALCACVLGLVSGVHAQGLTGQMSGSVIDSSQAVLPGATVTVTNAGTQASRTVTTDANGLFTVTELLAGRYEVTVTLEGFKTYVQRDVVLSANERVALRPIALEVGTLNETIAVTAEAARVQTLSGERSGTITQDQIQDVSLKGKDYMGMLRHVPGVVDTQNREAPGWNNLGGISINGGRNNTVNLTYDGVTNLDTGSNTGPFLAPGLDSIAEIKVLTSNYQAEFGRSSGGTINVVTKSGGRDFHGGGFYSKRNEDYNANEWQNNKFGRPKPPYRFDYSGYHIGGPVLLPGDFNSGRNKLFFFWNQEFLPRTNPGNLERRTMPTELERRGDFSQSLDTNGRLIVVRDPQTGQAVPGQHHPDQPHRRERPGAAQPVPGAERHRPRPPVQLHVPERLRAAAQRPGAARRLERRAQDHLLLAPQLRLRGVQGRLGLRAEQRQLAAAADRLRDPQLRHRQHGPAHVQPDDRDGSDRRPQPRQADRGAAHARRSAAQRPDAGGPERAAAVLPRGEPGQHRPQRQLHGGGPRAGQPAAAGRRRPLSVLRRERHLEQLGEPDQGRRLAQHEGGPLLRVHDAAGGAQQPVQRHLQLQPRHQQPAGHQPPVRQRADRVGSELLGGDRPSDCERAVRQRRVVRPGQLARVEEPDDRRGCPLLQDRAHQEPGRRPGRLPPGPVQPGGGPGADPAGEHAAGPARPQPDHRRDRPGGEDRHVRARVRATRPTASRCSTRA